MRLTVNLRRINFTLLGIVLLSLSILTAVQPEVANAQDGESSTISGTVTASDTGKPLAGVNVFLSGTTRGAATDSSGNYSIKNIPDGNYELVFSFLGFKTKVEQIRLLKPETLTRNATLEPKQMEMDEVQVVAEADKEWQRNLEVFKDQFLGETENARRTNIQNPEILDFRKNSKGDLFASAPEELKITNNALGYKVYVVLQKFRYSKANESGTLSEYVQYFVLPRYEEQKPINEDEKSQWKENRRDTYRGSARHFFNALYSDNVRNEGFRIRDGKIEKIEESEKNFALRYKVMDDSYRKTLKGFRLKPRNVENYVRVEYRDKTSYLFKTQEPFFFIDKFGNLLDARSLPMRGYWYNLRLADRLPESYRPGK